MLLLNMNSKRKRQPNIRLGEIGEVSAMCSWGRPHRPTARFEENRWGGCRKVDFHPTSTFSKLKPDFALSDSLEPEFITSDSLGTQNLENLNPNSFKPMFDVPGPKETDASKLTLCFADVNRKVRLMKRRPWKVSSSDSISKIWHYSVASGNSNGYGGGHTVDGNGESVMPSSTYEVDGFKNYLEDETPEVSERVCKDYVHKYMPRNNVKASNGLSANERDCLVYEDGEVNKRRACGTVEHGIKGWLDKLGFGRYAQIFEMHEVDEGALPLLTFDDLREMGINTIGTRRKMCTAIQLLKEGKFCSLTTLNK